MATYEKGLREASERAAQDIPPSAAAQAWEEDEQTRSQTLERLQERARTTGLLRKGPVPPPVVHENIVLPVFEPPPPATPPPPLPTPPPQASPRSALPEPSSPLHTYGSDFSDRVERTRASATSMLAAEQDARRERPAPVSPAPRKRGGLKIFIGAALVLVGIVGVYVAYTRYIATTGPINIAPTVSAPIFVDEREVVSGTGSALMIAFSQAVGRPLPSGHMRLVYDPNATTSASSVFNRLSLPAPGFLLRNIDAAGSMAGVVNLSGNQSPFFILAVTSYGDTFAGMLSWETSMLRDVSVLYPPYPLTLATTSSALAATNSTSSPQAKNILAPALVRAVTPPPRDQGFIDQVIANHDARIYRDGIGRSVIVYGYWNQTTLVIARDEAAFTAILGRLATSRSR